MGYRCFVTAGSLISQKQPLASCVLVFEVADVDDGDDDGYDYEICIGDSLSPPQPTTADQQQVDRRSSLNKRQGAETHW